MGLDENGHFYLDYQHLYSKDERHKIDGLRLDCPCGPTAHYYEQGHPDVDEHGLIPANKPFEKRRVVILHNENIEF